MIQGVIVAKIQCNTEIILEIIYYSAFTVMAKILI